MKKTILFSGYGGQGVLVMSKIVALAATAADKVVTWWPNYEGDQRGGLATATVVISDERVMCPAPSVGKTEMIVAMDNRTIKEFSGHLMPGGDLAIDSSIVNGDAARDDVRVLRVPADDIAKEVNAPRSANMVMCGAICAKYGFVDPEVAFRQIPVVCKGKEKFIPDNEAAFRAGMEYVLKN